MSQSTPAQQAAETKFAKTKAKVDDTTSSMAIHEKTMKLQRSNIERLKALRLARDAELAEAEPPPAPRSRRTKP